MKDLITVVVPIYNVEKYLPQCIESILAQDYSNLEIILVDDGSPDNCGVMIDEYAKKDKRIRIVHQQNAGLSAARNTGIKIAKGKYITFIDSDDFIDVDFISYLYQLIKEHDADVSVCNPYFFWEEQEFGEKKKQKEKKSVYSGEKALEVMLYQKEFETSSWGKLYKTEHFDDVLYPKGKLYEDLGTTYKILLKSNKVVVSNLEKLNYLQRSTSIIGSNFKPAEMDYVRFAEEICVAMKKKSKALEKAALSRYLSTNFSVLLKVNKTMEHSELETELKNNIKAVRGSVFWDKKVRLKSKVAILLSFVNFKLVYQFSRK